MTFLPTATRLLCSTGVLALFLWVGPPPGVCAEAVVLAAGEETCSAEGHFESLPDPRGAFSLADVVAGAAARGFRPVPHFLSRGYTNDVTWVRFAVERGPGSRDEWRAVFDPAPLDHVTVYVQTGTAADDPASYRRVELGDHVPSHSRPIPHALPVVPLTLPLERPVRLYVRIDTTSVTLLGATFRTPEAFARWSAVRSHLLGAYFGVALFMAAGALLHWLWLRDGAYLLYAFYAFSLAVLQMSLTGSLSQLFPHTAHLWSDALASTSLCLGTASVFCFASRLLRLQSKAPWSHRLLSALAVAYVAVTPAAVGWGLRSVGSAVNGAALFGAVWILAVSLGLARRGHPPAGYAALAFSASTAGAVVSTLRVMGVLPHNALTTHAYLVGSLLQMGFLNAGLARRIQTAEEERETARRESLETAQNAERRALALVQERTLELEHSHEEIKRALAVEKQARDEQERFIDVVAHEYRTPLSILRSSLNALHNRLSGTGPEVRHGLFRMDRALDRLVSVLDRKLPVAKPTSPPFCDTDLVKAVAVAVARTVETFPGREVRGPTACPAGRFTLPADERLVTTAVENLLNNAVKYSDPLEPVGVELRETPTHVEVWVEDRGPGLPAEVVERVFDRFYRGPNTAFRGGTGMGLYLVREIATLHGGTVRFESELGRGSKVTLSLPRPGADEPPPRG